MKVLKALWGLIVDDGRMAAILVLNLVGASLIFKLTHFGAVAVLMIWMGPVISLVVAVEHQLRRKKPGDPS